VRVLVLRVLFVQLDRPAVRVLSRGVRLGLALAQAARGLGLRLGRFVRGLGGAASR
jgi:hypothetical protein